MLHKLILYAVISALLGVATFTITEVAQAQQPANVNVTAPSQVYQGRSYNVLIDVDPRNNSITAMQSNFHYDPQAVVINSIAEGNLFKQGGAPTLFVGGNYSYGVVYNIWTVILGMYNVSKPGTFAIVNVTAVKTGTFNFNISHVIISDPSSQSVPLQTFNTSAVVKSYPKYDVVEDGVVNILDINFVAQHFGEEIRDC